MLRLGEIDGSQRQRTAFEEVKALLDPPLAAIGEHDVIKTPFLGWSIGNIGAPPQPRNAGLKRRGVDVDFAHFVTYLFNEALLGMGIVFVGSSSLGIHRSCLTLTIKRHPAEPHHI